MQRRILALFLLSLVLIGKGFCVEPTDRNVLLRRNNPVVQTFDSLVALSVGNGEFVMSVDPTGLQTFPERYLQSKVLVTRTEWTGRHLGCIGFEFPSTIAIEDFSNIEQKLILNSGIIQSCYTLQGHPVSVYTVCHPERNIVAAYVKSELPIPVKLSFPYTKDYAGTLLWDVNQKHRTRLVSKRNNSAVLERFIDGINYYVVFQWQGSVCIVEKADNYYVVTPEKGCFAFSCEFLPRFSTTFDDIVLPSFKETAEESAAVWGAYWSGDCIKILADSTHLFSSDEERQMLLDCYDSAILSGIKDSSSE